MPTDSGLAKGKSSSARATGTVVARRKPRRILTGRAGEAPVRFDTEHAKLIL
jgi:hypothetical protein